MYEYKFVRLELSRGVFTKKPNEDYREVIHQHAREGWRLVQIFDPSTKADGVAAYFELIFERSTVRPAE